MSQRLSRVVIVSSVACIVAITLVPEGSHRAASYPFWCLRCGDFGSVDALLNTLLFVPLGLGLGLAGLRLERSVLASFLFTVTIEALQLTAVSGRDASLSDLLTNTAGGTLGALLATHWRSLLLPRPRTARALAIVGLGLWIGTRLLTAWFLAPSSPATLWYGQLAPQDVYPADFRGEVSAARIGALTVRSGPMPELRNALRGDATVVTARVSGAPPSPALASVVSVLDAHRAEIVVLGQEGTDARFRRRLRAADALFRVPSVRLASAFEGPADSGIVLTGTATRVELRLTAARGAQERTVTVALGAGLGWSLMMPWDVGLTESAGLVSAAFVGLALFAIGYVGGRGTADDGGRLVLALIGVGVAAGLLVPPAIFQVAAADGAESAAALLGAIVGLWTGRRATYQSHGASTTTAPTSISRHRSSIVSSERSPARSSCARCSPAAM